MGFSTATVKLVTIDGSTHVACSVGVGPVDSTYKAIDLITKVWRVWLVPHYGDSILCYFVYSREVYLYLTTHSLERSIFHQKKKEERSNTTHFDSFFLFQTLRFS